MRIKEIVYGLLDEERGNQRGDNVVHYLISGLIILNVFALFLESYNELKASYGNIFKSIEIVSIIVFSIEYAARIWTADLAFKNKGAFKSRCSYMFSFMGLIDLLSILPFYLPFLFKIDLRVIRTLRLLRLLRILKLNRHSAALRLIATVFKKSKNDIVATIFIVSILLVIAATLMYDLENKAQPDAFKNIGEALWWSVATLTTVGYGDIYPITGLGKLLSGIIALLGIGIVALPTGIISSAYIEEVQNRNAMKCCPHCDKDL
ncbi:ion transporter [Nonlabens sp.]|jgi:voltage-gated potassium channel|uniref:ion transporter n=1 Tax=Nonlabens sp. TaxID=1888209 RepID=UPI0039E51DB8